MKIQLRKISLLFTAAVMSLSMALVSCDKEKEANPNQKELVSSNSSREGDDQMPDDYVLMEIPAEYAASPEYQGDRDAILGNTIIKTESGEKIFIDYFFIGDTDGKFSTIAFSPSTLEQLNINQDYFLTQAGLNALSESTERGLITCLGGCTKGEPGKPCRKDCWKAFWIDLGEAIL